MPKFESCNELYWIMIAKNPAKTSTVQNWDNYSKTANIKTNIDKRWWEEHRYYYKVNTWWTKAPRNDKVNTLGEPRHQKMTKLKLKLTLGEGWHQNNAFCVRRVAQTFCVTGEDLTQNYNCKHPHLHAFWLGSSVSVPQKKWSMWIKRHKTKGKNGSC